ncbi:MAG: NUDIX hydrolase [Planctomycetes bacterium]|nr:NUDIX hydrolase [Planctomycetota bacterium]
MEKTLKTEIIYKGKKVLFQRDEVELESGRKTIRELTIHPGSAAIIPMLPDSRIIIIKQYRYAVKNTLYEIPAGTLEPGETPLQCAHRELKEETGYTAGKMEKLIQFYPSPGISNELMHLFFAKDLKKAGRGGSRTALSDETLAVLEVNMDEAIEMIKNGKIIDAKTICGILLCSKDL